MNKSTRKPYDGKRALLVKKLSIDFQVTQATVRSSINGLCTTEIGITIKKQYDKEYKALSVITTPITSLQTQSI